MDYIQSKDLYDNFLRAKESDKLAAAGNETQEILSGKHIKEVNEWSPYNYSNNYVLYITPI